MDLLNDIQQLIFTYCDWKQYYELCVAYGMPLRLKLLNDLPSIENMLIIEKICEEKKEYFEIVKYLHENGAFITTFAIYRASENGHFKIVKYLHENDAPITEHSINWASYNGHFKIVKYLHKNGAPITEYTIKNANRRGHFEVEKYLRDNIIPL